MKLVKVAPTEIVNLHAIAHAKFDDCGKPGTAAKGHVALLVFFKLEKADELRMMQRKYYGTHSGQARLDLTEEVVYWRGSFWYGKRVRM